MIRTTRITDKVFARGWLTRKEILAEHDKFWEEAKENRKKGVSSQLTFDGCREKINAFKSAKNRHERGKIIIFLAETRWTGVFDACDIANILISEVSVAIAAQRAMGKIEELERKYEENKAKVEVLKKGITQVIPSTWGYEFEITASEVTVSFFPPVRKHFVEVHIDNATDIYHFLKMVLIVRPMLHSAHIPFTFEVFSTLAQTWSMGQSIIAYGGFGMKGKEIVAQQKASWRDYLANYDIPDNIKETILDCLQDGIGGVQYGVWVDGEGGSYNSLTHKAFPTKGLWTGVA